MEAGAGGWRITTIKELLQDYHDSFNSFFLFFFSFTVNLDLNRFLMGCY